MVYNKWKIIFHLYPQGSLYTVDLFSLFSQQDGGSCKTEYFG